jgi:hypothetical protein
MRTLERLKFGFDLVFLVSIAAYLSLLIVQLPDILFTVSAMTTCNFLITYFVMASYVLKSKLVKTKPRLLWSALAMYLASIAALFLYSIYVSSSAITLYNWGLQFFRFKTSMIRATYIAYRKQEMIDALTNTLFVMLSASIIGGEGLRIYSLWGKNKSHDV